jgi:hypothetical protein
MHSVFSQISSELGGTLFSEASQMTFGDEHALMNAPARDGRALLVQQLNLVYRQPFSRFYELSSSHVYYVAGRTSGTASLNRVFGASVLMKSFCAAVHSDRPGLDNFVDFETLKSDAAESSADKSRPSGDCYRAQSCALRALGFNAVIADMAVNEGAVLEFSSLESGSETDSGIGQVIYLKLPLCATSVKPLPQIVLPDLGRHVGGAMEKKHAKLTFHQIGGFLQFDPTWAQFKTRHSGWLRARLFENDVVYRFPASLMVTLQSALGLAEEDLSAETDFDELSLRFHAVAVSNGRPIEYRWLLPKSSPPTDGQMGQMGMTDDQICQVLSLQDKANGISIRLSSILGRRVCNPDFLVERDRLRAAWLALSDDQRPPIPLSRTPRSSCLPANIMSSPAPPQVTEFLREFDLFCKKWRLSGMVTWDLPDPEGPMWPEIRPITDRVSDYSLVTTTPPEFPLRIEDGLGAPAFHHQRDIVSQHRVADLKRWQTYGLLFEIDHWERVIANRYADHKRPRGFVLKLEQIVGEIVHKDQTHIQKLRKKLHAFRQKSRTKLPRP